MEDAPRVTPEELRSRIALHANWVAKRKGGFRLNLAGADLRGAELRWATLARANLRGADLREADLRAANLSGSNLTGANLSGANLSGANLRHALLTGAQLPEFQLCPPKGVAFTGWKKVVGGFVLELEIPADAERTSSLVGRKCRASRALVVGAGGAMGGMTNQKEFCSIRASHFVYRLGEVAVPSDYDGDIRLECTRGVHFFMTREEAAAYHG